MRIKRPKKQRFNRYERQQERALKLEVARTGTGRYLYQNTTKGSLTLPKEAEHGVKEVPPGGTFIGDSYFKNILKFDIKTLQDLEEIKVENKLITEQPPIVTEQGKIEIVEQPRKQKINEGTPGQEPDVLLTEDPVGGVVIVD